MAIQKGMSENPTKSPFRVTIFSQTNDQEFYMHLEYEVCLAERSGASIFFTFVVQVRVRSAPQNFYFHLPFIFYFAKVAKTPLRVNSSTNKNQLLRKHGSILETRTTISCMCAIASQFIYFCRNYYMSRVNNV